MAKLAMLNNDGYMIKEVTDPMEALEILFGEQVLMEFFTTSDIIYTAKGYGIELDTLTSEQLREFMDEFQGYEHPVSSDDFEDNVREIYDMVGGQ